MNDKRSSVRAALYEPPGPKTKRVITIVTAISLLALAVLIALIVRRFYETGQLDSKYWSIFLRGTTWRFLGKGKPARLHSGKQIVAQRHDVKPLAVLGDSVLFAIQDIIENNVIAGLFNLPSNCFPVAPPVG